MQQSKEYLFEAQALQDYLAELYKTRVDVTEIRALERTPDNTYIKADGPGEALCIEVDIHGQRDRIVLHTIRMEARGSRAERAGDLIRSHDTFNDLQKHVPVLGLGAFTRSGGIQDLSNAGEFFLVSQYRYGRPFAEDLKKLTEETKLLLEDRQRTLALAEYLTEVHAAKLDNPTHYLKAIRDIIGGEDGVFELLDTFPVDSKTVTTERLLGIEKQFLSWRWRLKKFTDRLSQVHGDFHPWNILFQKDNDFVVLSGGHAGLGEPADDVSALSASIIFFSLLRYGALRGSYRVLFELFWEQYLQNSQDLGLTSVIQPFYARHALGLAHPARYPNLSDEIRQRLLVFVEQVLEEEWFDPQKVNGYLGSA
jgi:hypothetical protein